MKGSVVEQNESVTSGFCALCDFAERNRPAHVNLLFLKVYRIQRRASASERRNPVKNTNSKNAALAHVFQRAAHVEVGVNRAVGARQNGIAVVSVGMGRPTLA